MRVCVCVCVCVRVCVYEREQERERRECVFTSLIVSSPPLINSGVVEFNQYIPPGKAAWLRRMKSLTGPAGFKPCEP